MHVHIVLWVFWLDWAKRTLRATVHMVFGPNLSQFQLEYVR